MQGKLTVHEPRGRISRRAFVSSAAALTGPFGKIANGGIGHQTAFAYVGSFSFKNGPEGNEGNGKGITLFRVDLQTGNMGQVDVTPDEANPWWIALHPSKKFLYAANEITSPGEKSSGSISCYAIDPATGRLTLLNTVSSHGARPAQISVHPSGKYVFSANFGGGNIAVFPVDQNGALGDPVDTEEDHGIPGATKSASGPASSFADSGHDRPHPHMVLADPAGRFVLESDLGLDQIMTWNFDGASGKLTRADVPPAAFPSGDGPRHFTFHQTGKWLYSLQEEGCTVVAFDYDAATGKLTNKQTISTVPKGFAGSDYTSEIIVSPDGRYVYAVNRLYDSIVHFEILSDGTLRLAGDEWTRGDFPRHIAFDATHSFLYCCNQKSDAITTFKVDRATGRLTFTGQFTAVGTPAILVFL